MRFALIGQPNCGKSTLFNQVAGYKAETGNFSGTTVTYTESKVRVAGEVITLVDLPGTYTLAGGNPAERETWRYLNSHHVDVVINVLDATNLAQGLTLTLALLELQLPMVAAVNMMDEAARLGIKIDGNQLQEKLGIPVLPLVASKGRGVKAVFLAANRVGAEARPAARLRYGNRLEEAIQAVTGRLNGAESGIRREALAIWLLENEAGQSLPDEQIGEGALAEAASWRKILKEARGVEAVWVIAGERHGLAENLARAVSQQGERRLVWRDRLDDLLLHPVWGYVFLVFILLLLFDVIYRLGSVLEGPLIAFFDGLDASIAAGMGAGKFWTGILTGMLQGIAGGVAIVLPYLLPFLLGLGFLEDVGYLPRVAFLMDALMHRIGLHGKAVVPFILGYGCNVPAVMSTRMLEERRDRFLAAALATMVPCAARLAVVFGLVAFYLGSRAALLIYLFNLLVIAFTGRVLSALMPEDTPGLIFEMPAYRAPTLRAVINKTWFRAREFVIEAWPILIIGSAVLAVINHFGFAGIFNWLVRPITWALGLPGEVGVPLIFGILRKELSLIMLRQALGGGDFGDLLTNAQMVTFTVFVVFYVPCLATLAVLRRELGTKDMLNIAALSVLIATAAGLAARGLTAFLMAGNYVRF
jgi:ferrous iron transport protein B